MGTNFTITGRAVEGDPYKMTQRVDDKTKVPKVKADGTPMMSSYLAIAIPKTDPTWPAHRAMFDAEALKAWPNGQTQHPQFANKIEDGDSTIPNKKGKRNCDREGWPGHWIVKLSSGYAPKVYIWDAARGWVESTGGHVKLGDFVSVAGSIESNKSAESPGMYMNLNQIAFEREGPAITLGVDPTTAFGTRGPGGAAIPPSPAPVASPPAPAATPPASGTAAPGDTTWMNPPPAPPAAGPVMTAKAAGATYESFITAGWTDEAMRAQGYLA